MKSKPRLKKLEEYVKKISLKEKSGHDYSHAKRVTKLAIKLAKDYKNINYEILISSCLIHDIYEKHNIQLVLKKLKFTQADIKRINEIIIQFRHIGKKPNNKFIKSIESEIFLDADNLDALGAIGIIRAISFGLTKNFPMFISKNDSLDESIYGTIKSLTSWDKSMYSKKAKKIAKGKIKIMKVFLKNIESDFKNL